MTRTDSPLLLRPTEAAAQLSISRSLLYELLRDGTIPAVRIGRATRIPTAALEDFVASRVEGGR